MTRETLGHESPAPTVTVQGKFKPSSFSSQLLSNVMIQGRQRAEGMYTRQTERSHLIRLVAGFPFGLCSSRYTDSFPVI